MAYSTTNPPLLTPFAPLAGAGKTWMYRSTDLGSAVDAAGYFTNALDLGMTAGDIVLVQGTTAFLMTMHSVMTVSSTGADLGDGTTISSTSNAD